MFVRLRLLVGLLAILTIFVPSLAQEDINVPSDLSLTIVSEPVVDDGSRAIRVQFIVEDNGIPVVDLTSSAIVLSEAAENIQLLTSFERSLNLAIVIDLSFGSDADLVRDTLRAFFDNYYLPQDNISLYILDAGVIDDVRPRIVTIDSLETANRIIDELRSAEQLFSVEAMLQRVFDDLQEIPDISLNSRQVLFVGSLFNRPSDASQTQVFAENNIAVHGVQAHRTREEFTRTYRGLTNTGGGLFANNFEGIFVIPGETYQPINNLKVLYDTIGNSRVVYTLTWHTLSRSLNSARNVNISFNLPTGASLEQNINYTFSFQAPQVVFVNQRSFDVERRVFRLDDLSLDFELDERVVPVEILFPDGVPRRIVSLRLEVSDTATGEILQSELILEPELIANGQYMLNWYLTDYITPDSLTDVQLMVTVNDELGLSASSATGGSVLVAPAPPIPTATPTATPLPSETPTPTEEATAIPVVLSQSGDGNFSVFGGGGGNGLTGLLLGIIVILISMVVFLLVRSRRFQRNIVASSSATASTLDTSPPAAPITEVPIEQEEGHRFAQLVAVNGTGERLGIEHIWLDRRQFTIGRAETCDFVIDSPILDAEHCLITIQKFDEIFVRDLNSINGTFVNGERLQGSDEHFVPMGSELGLTKELTFEIWESDKDLQEVEHLSTVIKSSLYSNAESVPFKPLAGIHYAPDDGSPIEDDYSPI